jgi:membrane-associated protease RseP (regulator of RpoE activity)
MSETPLETSSTQQGEFEKLTQIVSAEFQVEEALLEHNVPTFYLKQPQETKQAFLRLLKNLEKTNLMAFLQKIDNRIVLKIFPKPPAKPSNILINWALFFATIVTTFITGYIISPSIIDPLIGGTAFTIAIMSVLGAHEMGHKITANKRDIEASPPYFIPGPPPIGQFFGIGTFGAVIVQKSLPRNKDALFDIGLSGPFIGFAISVIATFVGLVFSPTVYRLPEGPFMPVPILFDLAANLLYSIGVFGSGNIILVHPIAFAGIIGMIVTMLNLLPAGMLDGGHIAKAIFGDKVRGVLAAVSIIFLFLNGYYPMAFFVLFLSLFRHPGPLDAVSPLSRTRKLVIPVLLIVFILCGVTVSEPVHKIEITSEITDVASNVAGVGFRIYYADSFYYCDETPWSAMLAEGFYIIKVNSTVTINGSVYTFIRWEDGTSNLTRTIFLNQSIQIRATYERSIV